MTDLLIQPFEVVATAAAADASSAAPGVEGTSGASLLGSAGTAGTTAAVLAGSLASMGWLTAAMHCSARLAITTRTSSLFMVNLEAHRPRRSWGVEFVDTASTVECKRGRCTLTTVNAACFVVVVLTVVGCGTIGLFKGVANPGT